MPSTATPPLKLRSYDLRAIADTLLQEFPDARQLEVESVHSLAHDRAHTTFAITYKASFTIGSHRYSGAGQTYNDLFNNLTGFGVA